MYQELRVKKSRPYKQKFWDDKEIEFLIKSYPDPYVELKKICKNLGRTRSSVTGKAKYLKMKRPKEIMVPDEFKQDLLTILTMDVFKQKNVTTLTKLVDGYNKVFGFKQKTRTQVNQKINVMLNENNTSVTRVRYGVYALKDRSNDNISKKV